MDIEQYVRKTLGSVDDQADMTIRQRLARRYRNFIDATKLRLEIVQCAPRPAQQLSQAMTSLCPRKHPAPIAPRKTSTTCARYDQLQMRSWQHAPNLSCAGCAIHTCCCCCRYRYYNWRKDTASDLFLILMINAAFITAGAVVKFAFVDPYLAGTDVDPNDIAAAAAGVDTSQVNIWERLWPDVYQVILLTFGENFPDASESWLFQIYSIAMGLLGVIGFALLLALTEQIILEVLESNVRQGTKVFERDHVLVLAQCIGGKDMEQLWRMLNQARGSLHTWNLMVSPSQHVRNDRQCARCCRPHLPPVPAALQRVAVRHCM
jgi:hypothetical protein